VVLGGEAQDPTPVHAYAAAGDRAPEIIRTENDVQMIRCPRCDHASGIQATRCGNCGMAFTLEGVTYDPPEGSRNGYAIASLVLSLVGLPCFVLVLPQILAVVFGVVAMRQLRGSGPGHGRGFALTGIALGLVSLAVVCAAFVVR
jgi:hypothetical protein